MTVCIRIFGDPRCYSLVGERRKEHTRVVVTHFPVGSHYPAEILSLLLYRNSLLILRPHAIHRSLHSIHRRTLLVENDPAEISLPPVKIPVKAKRQQGGGGSYCIGTTSMIV